MWVPFGYEDGKIPPEVKEAAEKRAEDIEKKFDALNAAFNTNDTPAEGPSQPQETATTE